MDKKTLDMANKLAKKIQSVECLIENTNEHNVVTIGVGDAIPIRYSNTPTNTADKLAILDSACYKRIVEVLVQYKTALQNTFKEL